MEDYKLRDLRASTRLDIVMNIMSRLDGMFFAKKMISIPR
jgi:hypothetical protein